MKYTSVSDTLYSKRQYREYRQNLITEDVLHSDAQFLAYFYSVCKEQNSKLKKKKNKNNDNVISYIYISRQCILQNFTSESLNFFKASCNGRLKKSSEFDQHIHLLKMTCKFPFPINHTLRMIGDDDFDSPENGCPASF